MTMCDPTPEQSGKQDPQMAVFLEAFRIYQERNARHGDVVWKASGWNGMLNDMRKKLDRVWFEFMSIQADEDTSEMDLDSALDLLNYTVFFIRQVRASDKNGYWPWPTK